MSVARRCDLRPGAHPDEGKTFIVIDGQLRIDFRDGSVALQAGVVFVVPKGRAFFGARASLCIPQASVICSEMCNAERPLGVASTYSPRGPGNGRYLRETAAYGVRRSLKIVMVDAGRLLKSRLRP